MANTFGLEIKKWNGATDKAMREVLQATALKLTASIIKRTPVDTGRARGNWQVGINNKPDSVVATTDKSGNAALSNGANTIRTAGTTDTISVINNLPYIQKLENGSSQQAPAGMVKVTVTEFQRALNKSVQENKV